MRNTVHFLFTKEKIKLFANNTSKPRTGQIENLLQLQHEKNIILRPIWLKNSKMTDKAAEEWVNGFYWNFPGDDTIKNWKPVEKIMIISNALLSFGCRVQIKPEYDNLLETVLFQSFVNGKIMIEALIANNHLNRNHTEWANKIFVCMEIFRNGGSLRHLDENLKKHKKIVKLAVSQNGWVLEDVHETLRKDKKIVLAATIWIQTDCGGKIENSIIILFLAS